MLGVQLPGPLFLLAGICMWGHRVGISGVSQQPGVQDGRAMKKKGPGPPYPGQLGLSQKREMNVCLI